jgi:prepilin-type N-terminal cleavage/methylation domain-containing protein/prepilin-type processing-associated H-X9-DG protein
MSLPKPFSRGLSLIELLVAISIIGILLSLVLPAVQSARQAAFRLKCANQLRQQVLALHQAHDRTGHFPSGVIRIGSEGQRQTGWMVAILPDIEQEALWQQSRTAFERHVIFTEPPSPISHVVKLYGCPADDRTSVAQLFQKRAYALTSYLGVSGLDLVVRNGVLYDDSKTRISDITDGTSSTVIIGERPPAPNFEFGWWYGGLGQARSGSLDTVLGAAELNRWRNGRTRPDCPPGPYSFVVGSRQSICDIFHFWSVHPGGAHFALADGSVRFLNYSASKVLEQMATRSGGEVITD